MTYSSYNKLFFTVITVTTLFGCEAKQQLADMHDTTMAMSTTTKSVLSRSDELYDASKQGVTLQIRRDSFAAILASKSYGKKISDAAQYFMSFEYQLWQGTGEDMTSEKRLRLLKDATTEFFKSVQEFYNNDPAVSFFVKPDSTINQDADNREASFNATAVALHCMNRKQEEMLSAHPEQKPISMLSIIEEALSTEKDLNADKIRLRDVPEYLQEVLNNKKIAVKLLQARQGFLPMLFLGKVSPIQGGFVDAGEMALTNWTFNLDEFDISQVTELETILKASLDAQNFLNRVGIAPQKSSMLTRLLRNMQITSSKAGSALTEARTKLITVINQLRK